jgi:hypothetical protein
MAPFSRLSFLFAFVLFSSPVFALDDDDIFFDEDPEEEDEDIPGPRIEEDDTLEVDEDDAGLDEETEATFEQIVGSEAETLNIDLGLDDEDDDLEDETIAPGQDTAAIYRQQLAAVEGMAPDEEGMAWEVYLQTYTASVFRTQIDERMAKIADGMFGGSGGPSGPVDEAQKAMNFAHGLLLESIDPRTRFRAGFEWGYIDWVNLILDYEVAVRRDLGIHGGLQHRLSGWNLEGGARYALIKSTRTNMILTAIGDVHLNLDPIAPGFRPMMALGKRIETKGSTVIDIQAQTGVDLMIYPEIFSPRMLGGMNISVSPSETVKVFMETTYISKAAPSDDTSPFTFNQIAFGIRFQGKGNMLVGTGAAVPYASNYWKYHYGSVLADFNYYM